MLFSIVAAPNLLVFFQSVMCLDFVHVVLKMLRLQFTTLDLCIAFPVFSQTAFTFNFPILCISYFKRISQLCGFFSIKLSR